MTIILWCGSLIYLHGVLDYPPEVIVALSIEERKKRQAEYQKKKRELTNNAYMREYMRKRKQENREYARGIKSERGCQVCGEKRAVCLDFHHRPGTEKVIEVGLMMTYPRKAIDEEIAKCDVLCRNCHAWVTWGDK
jgi:hypothetical protein